MKGKKIDMKNFKKNQVVIFVIALMLVTAGYLNFTNEQSGRENLLPTSSLADSKQMAAIGDATLVSANQTVENNQQTTNNTNTAENNSNANNVATSNTSTNTTKNENTQKTSNHTGENKETSNQVNTNPKQADSYFAQSKLDRDNMYSQMLTNYQKILETNNIEAEEKTKAQNEIKKINNEKNAIMIAENLIKTKGFEDVVLFVNNGNVSAIIKTEKLDENQIAQIQNIITRELNVKVTKINVSSKN